MHLEKQPAAEIAAGVESSAGIITVGQQRGARALRDLCGEPPQRGVLAVATGLLIRRGETSNGLPKKGAGGERDYGGIEQRVPTRLDIVAQGTGRVVMPSLRAKIGIRHQAFQLARLG